MPQVSFARSFEFRDPQTQQRTRFPAFWAGEVPKAIADAADAAGALAAMPEQDRLGGSGVLTSAGPASDTTAPTDPGVTPAPMAQPVEGVVATDGSQTSAPAGEAGTLQPPDGEPMGDGALTREELEAMTVSDLKDEARDRGISVPSGATKAEIVALLTA